MTWLLMNIPLMVLFVALCAGIPLWLVLRHPDRKPALAAAPPSPACPRGTACPRATARTPGTAAPPSRTPGASGPGPPAV